MRPANPAAEPPLRASRARPDSVYNGIMYRTIVATKTLNAQLANPDWVVFDCRFNIADKQAGLRAYKEGHIPGARYVSLDDDLSSPATDSSGRHPLPDPRVIGDKLAAWGLNHSSQAVVYDQSIGSIAVRMWWVLRWLGHRAVAVLDGGIDKWADEELPMDGAPVHPERGDFEGRPDDDAWVSTADVESLRLDPEAVVIDARSAARFSGEQEEVDRIGGHIPGSVNHPLTRNIGDDGCFLPAEELRALYEPLRKPATIHSCGSGVTASHNMLAMEIAGLKDSKLYVGSWSEWIRSPHRPVATGED